MGLAEWTAKVEEEKALKARLAELGAVEKKASTAWLCWVVWGWFGGHRFYLREHGWLMLIWLILGIFVFPSVFGAGRGFGVWGYGLLAWLAIDAFLIPGWVRAFQKPYEKAVRKLEEESLGEVLTMPLMQAAQKHGGTLTVAQGVLATGLTFVEVEKGLMAMSKTGYVQIENTEDGNLLFDFGDLPEYDEDEAIRRAAEEGHAVAVEEMAEMLEEQALEEERGAARDRTRSAAKQGLVAGAAMFGARALLGEVFDGDDDDE